jgi:hypothetical protein
MASSRLVSALARWVWVIRLSRPPIWIRDFRRASPPAHPLKAHLSQIERFDKHADHANRVALVYEMI